MNEILIPRISIPLEHYLFLLVCRSKYEYAVIDSEVRNYILACPRWEEQCHLETSENNTGVQLWRLYRLDAWTRQLERQAEARRSQETNRLVANVMIEKRKTAIGKLLMAGYSQKTAEEAIDLIMNNDNMKETKELLGLL